MMTADTATTEVFNQHRNLVFSIAYRMLGSVMDAEDAVQETYLRWQQAPVDDVRAPKSYLSTVVTRLCIDQLRSAKRQREEYIGPWLPEPLFAEETPDMDQNLALSDSLSMAFLVMLEALNPTERAALLLRDAFEYPYDEIAAIVDKSEANCRQMVRRARQHIAERKHRFAPTNEQVQQLTTRFLRAAQQGDMGGLLEMLEEDVTLWSDGGGKTNAALNPIYGADKVARFFIGIMKKFPKSTVTKAARVNGQPGLVMYIQGQPYCVAVLETKGAERAAGIRIVVNPDKLRHVPALT
jgi:RNA polymerase sigma-70 factor (ECF subfamily)